MKPTLTIAIWTLLSQISITAFAQAERLPTSSQLIAALNQESWAKNIQQIPATVIDKGILRNVPYMSYRVGQIYEVNMYGDPDHLAGIEVGVIPQGLKNPHANANCFAFINRILKNTSDKEMVNQLGYGKAETSFQGLTFEITVPADEDSYGGWWISIYDKKQIESARASDAEMAHISQRPGVSNNDAKSASPDWSAAELKLARPAPADTISYTNKAGDVFTNVQVVKVIDGTSLIWRDASGGGMVKLSDLPPDLQTKFGYDPEKAHINEAAAEEKRAREHQILQAQAQALAQNAHQPPDTYLGGGGSGSSGGRVYVRGYTRRDGTYVSGYTRSSPRR